MSCPRGPRRGLSAHFIRFLTVHFEEVEESGLSEKYFWKHDDPIVESVSHNILEYQSIIFMFIETQSSLSNRATSVIVDSFPNKPSVQTPNTTQSPTRHFNNCEDPSFHHHPEANLKKYYANECGPEPEVRGHPSK
ncbi:hypothetical protein CDAR_412371 [Caerostris darwini]|uniref:Uncharacterized protein n=1 Tax=Caerostris darwini TaxID=1538125 RepID=A0AAV4T275_9ARAC|nr:hypothetical protein CDAR_412371 [Caerostris darwini]